MNDEQRRTGPDQPRTETESSDYQHKAEKLALENKMLRAVLDSMPDNISIKDLEGRYIFDNTSHCRFLGAMNTADVVGKNLADFLPAPVAAKFHAEDLSVLRSGEAVVGSVKNARLEEDLETARELQNALLPQEYPRFPSSASPETSALRFHHFFRPCSAVGGDFFQVFQISDCVAGVVICDVMGHGVRAALVAAILRALVEDLRARATEPARFLQELNRGISHILKHTRLTMFVSACYLVVDVARGELRYANAGHPTPLWVHRALRSAEPLPFGGSKPDPVLGIFDDAQYHSSSCKLRPGDTLLLFSDGLFEVEGADAKYYDQLRLLRSASQRASLCADELCQQLVDEVQQFAATKDFADDVCLIAIEIDHLV